jgi:hypothetical protein
MDKATFYREKLLYFLDREDEPEAMLDWIDDLPELEQPDVLRLLTTLLQERGKNTGEQEWIELSKEIADKIDDYEEEILDKKLDEALFMMQFDKVAVDAEKLELFLDEARKGIIKTILSKPENIKELQKIARLAIKIEKDTGFYSPFNWRVISEYL